MIKSIIVEDEHRHSNRLRKMLATLDASINILDVCTTVEEAVTMIDERKPEIVFLDICLDDNRRAGFDILNKVKDISFDVIFTTAHIDDNIKEIRRCGLDYIAKPYIEDELADALNKFWVKKEGHIGTRQIKALLNNLVTENLDDQLVWLYDKDYDFAVKVRNIIYFEAQSYPKEHTKIYFLEDGALKHIDSSFGIGRWEENMQKYKFCRIHRQHLVNFRHISRFNRLENMASLGIVEKNFPVSRTGREKLSLMMNK